MRTPWARLILRRSGQTPRTLTAKSHAWADHDFDGSMFFEKRLPKKIFGRGGSGFPVKNQDLGLINAQVLKDLQFL